MLGNNRLSAKSYRYPLDKIRLFLYNEMDH